MNIVKSPYQLMLEQLGLSPAEQQMLSPAQMQAEMIARGQTPSTLQQPVQYMAEGSSVSSVPAMAKQLPAWLLHYLGPIGAATTASEIPSQLSSGDREGAFNTLLDAGSWLAPRAAGLLGLAIQSNELNEGEQEQVEALQKAYDDYMRSQSPVFKQ